LKRNDEIKVSFGIYDFQCSFDEITSLVGFSPDKTLLKGSKIKLANGKELNNRVMQNAWFIESYSNNPEGLIQEQFEYHMKSILDRLTPHLHAVKQLNKEYHLEFSVNGYVDGSNIGLNLKPEYLRVISDFGASLDIDIYSLGDNED